MNKHDPYAFAPNLPDVPRHVAIIMDGNGRWAQQRGLPRTAGHRQGVEAVREVVQAARDIGVEYLTLYSFSTENWRRPKEEITELFSLLRYFIRRDLAELHENNVRIRVIGEREGVPQDLLELLDDAQLLTGNNTGQTLVVAFNYGARGEITKAIKSLSERVASGEIASSDISEGMISDALDTSGIPDPDLLIRTSGEVRLSNFLLWQLAYTELIFVDCYWPDFSRAEFLQTLEHFCARNRRFGSIAAEAGS